jgi:hypothetical protein
MLYLLRRLGFESNEEKNGPPAQDQVFLGVGMDACVTFWMTMTYFFTVERIAHICSVTLELEHAGGRVRVSRIMSVLGKWGFLAQIVVGMGLYLRSGYSCIRGRAPGDFVKLTQQFRKDLAFLRKLVEGGALRISMERRPLTSGFAAWDACTHWGMGGFLDGAYFSIAWSDLMSGTCGLVEAFFPFHSVASSHINYLELFAAYWFLRTWGARLRGHSVLCHSDSEVVVGMLRRLWGEAPFIPLLKEILKLLVRHDLSLDVHWLSSKANILADCLSRGDFTQYRRAAADFARSAGFVLDRDDWMLMTETFRWFDKWLGPFQVDACVDKYRVNSHCAVSWTASQDCARQRWHGLTVFCNGPFSALLRILQHFVRCKAEEPVGTAALFIIPLWVGADFLEYIHSLPAVFQVVARFDAGEALFTRPVPAHQGGGRQYAGPTRWPVLAVWAGPAAVPGLLV